MEEKTACELPNEAEQRMSGVTVSAPSGHRSVIIEDCPGMPQMAEES
jgi:hypothetical protein